ncbi:hypothetical protein SAMN04487943_101414 [Gracilibacillus orientalis]|uniref:YhfM-like domain-containing protein n=1 Tax=Gracilibacillus orientalis TaxID=334253 RepID=A0A1I4HH58_9BACI|nr:hypothetical protein [Gracilibacillus orientalis]SFL41080.1 hypothetical protein SAMN04487943_101414 [Gracilibacillus orientalis]
MRVFWCCATFVIFTFFLVSCSLQNKVTIFEMESFEKIKVDTALDITDEEEIKVFDKAVKSANREPGVVDVSDPDYKFEYGKKSYFLWISAGSGSVMKTSNTNTIYTLEKDSAKQVFDITDNYGE